MADEILTPEQVRLLRETGGPMTSEQLDNLEHLARTSGRKLHPDKALALIARVRALEADRDRLAAEVERLRAHHVTVEPYTAIDIAYLYCSCGAAFLDGNRLKAHLRAVLAEAPPREESSNA